jgi:hypothetical protein
LARDNRAEVAVLELLQKMTEAVCLILRAVEAKQIEKIKKGQFPEHIHNARLLGIGQEARFIPQGFNFAKSRFRRDAPHQGVILNEIVKPVPARQASSGISFPVENHPFATRREGGHPNIPGRKISMKQNRPDPMILQSLEDRIQVGIFFAQDFQVGPDR